VPVGASVTFRITTTCGIRCIRFLPAKRFELPLYAGVPAQPVVFDKPGWWFSAATSTTGWWDMSTYPNRLFAKTGKDGKAVLAELPPRICASCLAPAAETSGDAT
jgi:hypothetical protein